VTGIVERTPLDPEAMLLFEGDPGPYGLAVEAIGEQFSASPGDLLPVPGGLVEGCTPWIGAFRLGNQVLPVLGPGRVCPEGYRALQSDPAGEWPSVERYPVLRAAFLTEPGRSQLFLFPARASRLDYEVSFTLSGRQILELASLEGLTLVSPVRPGVAGLALWRQLPLAAIDLALYLGVADRMNEDASRLLVTRTPRGEGLLGILVGSESAVLDLPLPNQRWAKELPVPANLVLGAFDIDGDLLLIPDLAAI
jgi:chemotaxis signal transduction protein